MTSVTPARPVIEPMPWAHPALGAAVDAVEGIRWIRHYVPGALKHINVWLLPGRSGRVLVDTGMRLQETADAWEALAASERLPETLERILVTHHHPDHFGQAGHLSRRFGVPVRMSGPSRAAIEHILAGGATRHPEVLEAYRQEWGFEFQSLLAGGQAGMGTYDSLVTGLPEAGAPLDEGERPAELRDPWTVSLHHGHAEGHACLHWEDAGLLVSGDQLLPTISSNISLYPDVGSSDPLGDYFASLDRLDALPADTVVLPSHGQPFRGVQARVAQLRAEHEGRLAEIEHFCATPREAGEIVMLLFGRRPLDGMNRLLAYGETLAHIRHLRLRGRVVRTEAGGKVRWVKA